MRCSQQPGSVPQNRETLGHQGESGRQRRVKRLLRGGGGRSAELGAARGRGALLLRGLVGEHRAVHGGNVAAAAGVGQAQVRQGQEALGAEVAQRRARGAQRGQEDLQRREEAHWPGLAAVPRAPSLLSGPRPAPTSVTSSGSCAASRKIRSKWRW